MKLFLAATLTFMIASPAFAQISQEAAKFDFVKPFTVMPLEEAVEVSAVRPGHLIYTRKMKYVRSAVIGADTSFSTPIHDVEIPAGTELWGAFIQPVPEDRPSLNWFLNDGPEIAKLRKQGHGINSDEVKEIRKARMKRLNEFMASDKMHELSERSLEGAPWVYCGELNVTFKKNDKKGNSRLCLEDATGSGYFTKAYFITMRPDPSIAADGGVALDPVGLNAPYEVAGAIDMNVTAVALIEKKRKSYSFLLGMTDKPKKKIKMSDFRLFPEQRHLLDFSSTATATAYGDVAHVEMIKKKRLNVMVEPSASAPIFARSFGELSFDQPSN